LCVVFVCRDAGDVGQMGVHFCEKEFPLGDNKKRSIYLSILWPGSSQIGCCHCVTQSHLPRSFFFSQCSLITTHTHTTGLCWAARAGGGVWSRGPNAHHTSGLGLGLHAHAHSARVHVHSSSPLKAAVAQRPGWQWRGLDAVAHLHETGVETGVELSQSSCTIFTK